jgi:general secretion pathway protein F
MPVGGVSARLLTMATYEYKAVKANGDIVEGDMEAPDEAAVVMRLQAEGLIPVRTAPARRGLKLELSFGAGGGRKIGSKQITLLTRELASLLEAGLTLDRALQILLELTDDPAMSHLLGTLQEKIRGGKTFSVALEEHRTLFSKLYVNMVRAGEAGGALQAVMASLADYLERSEELRESVKSALIYPTILVTVAGLSVAMLLVFVVPQFAQMFADMGQTLPLATRIVIGAGDLVRGYWWLLGLLGFAAYLGIRSRLARPEVRYVWDRRLLGMPLLGELVAKVETARFSRTLSTLVTNGVSLLGALNLVKDVISNRIIAESIELAADKLRHGSGLAEPLMEQGVFPKLALQMMKVGEESGQLEVMLSKVADMYDKEVRATVQRMLALLEPLLIVGLGVVVAGIIMSILVAIMSVNQLAI